MCMKHMTSLWEERSEGNNYTRDENERNGNNGRIFFFLILNTRDSQYRGHYRIIIVFFPMHSSIRICELIKNRTDSVVLFNLQHFEVHQVL
jgi:hypothetical protein